MHNLPSQGYRTKESVGARKLFLLRKASLQPETPEAYTQKETVGPIEHSGV